MSARPELDALIARLRSYVDDNGTSQTFTDDQLIAFLDNHTFTLYQEPLKLVGIPLVGDRWYTCTYTNIATDAVIYTPSYAPVTPTTSDFVAARFLLPFASLWTTGWPGYGYDQVGTYYRIYGTAYDLHAAAADAWSQIQGNRSLWKGQTGLLIGETIKRHLSLAWGGNGQQVRV